jgi:dynein heavy chain
VLCQAADSFDVFKSIPKHMLANPAQWKVLAESPNVHLEEEVEFPKDFAHLNRFQKLIIIRILRPEKVIPAIQQLVIKELGEKFVEIPPFDLESTYQESSCRSPLIFILSSGADPRGELENLALKMGMR